MGIKTSTRGESNAVFLRINGSEGCFQQGNGDAKVSLGRESYVEGMITGVKVESKSWPDGTTNDEVRLQVRDSNPEEPVVYVSLRVANNNDPAYIGLRTLAALNAADFSKPIAIKPYLFKAGDKNMDGTLRDKDSAGVSIQQDGKPIQAVFGTEDGRLPVRPPIMNAGRPVMVNGRAVVDNTAWNGILDQQLEILTSKFAPAPAQADKQSIDPAEAIAAAQAATSRESMRARA